MKYIALFLSGGIGSRIGGEVPKQYITVGDAPVFSYSLDVLMNCDRLAGVRIVADPEWEGEIEAFLNKSNYSDGRFMGFSLPGATRQLSILNGIRDIASDLDEDEWDDTFVIVHDAARPGLTAALLETLMDACPGHDGALPVLSMKDTIYESKDGKVISGLLDRNTLFAGQAPEAYVLDKYLKANEALLPKDILTISGACEPAVRYGMDIALLPGDEKNVKITTPEDLETFEKTVIDQDRAY
ncbi:MAG: 2-C-methyl-D-erythritol 4-phosphate cytidylyltransferase [Lachnospiraceae bacterium]|nr:2-C-methyl-D-erythritol 4-phosphate cytidylyltransferase [Lachnospiraceae bacterium]